MKIFVAITILVAVLVTSKMATALPLETEYQPTKIEDGALLNRGNAT